jgi:phospholipid/cholesterol/gamma-HCH transport system substrate-binding protein
MSKELKVGLFVIISAFIFLATFAYVDQLSGVRIPYKAYFRYAGGIDPGSPVRFGGMKVGTITAIRPWRQDPTKIEVLLEVKGGVPVNADSIAMLTSLNPLGDRYLEITTGSDKVPRLPPGATIPSTEPVSLDDLARQASALIPTFQSTLQNVQKDIDRITGRTEVVLANVQAMTGPNNQRNLALLLSNARDVLDKESPQVDQLLHNLNRASAQATAILSQASNVLTNVGVVAQSANTAFTGVNQTVGEIRDPIKTDLAELQRTMTDARRLMVDLNTLVSVNRYKVNDTFDNFRAASENLRELTALVKQRPWTLLRGKPAPDRAVPVVARRK